MKGGGSTPRRPGGPVAETELERTERQVRELEQELSDQHRLVTELQAARRNSAGARERLFQLAEMVQAARQRVEELKPRGH